MGFFAVVLLLLLIFILQNGATVQVSYLGAHGRLPLGVAMLLSTVCGVLLVVLAGAARISQLRTTARRHRRIDARRAAAVPAASPASPAVSRVSRAFRASRAFYASRVSRASHGFHARRARCPGRRSRPGPLTGPPALALRRRRPQPPTGPPA